MRSRGILGWGLFDVALWQHVPFVARDVGHMRVQKGVYTWSSVLGPPATISRFCSWAFPSRCWCIWSSCHICWLAHNDVATMQPHSSLPDAASDSGAIEARRDKHVMYMQRMFVGPSAESKKAHPVSKAG